MSFVVMNAVTVPAERAAEFEQRFATRAGKIKDSPGFEASELWTFDVLEGEYA